MGIEPTSKAWEALVLPLNYTRAMLKFYANFFRNFKLLQINLSISRYVKPKHRLATILTSVCFRMSAGN